MSYEQRIGIVGFGGAGMAQYVHFESLAGCKVVSVYDTKKAGLERARARSASLKLFDDYDEFLGSGISAVSVCSPDSTHSEYMVRALAAKKHCICEKPLADSLIGCKRIIEATKKNTDCVAAVQHQMRFLPIHIKMREIIQSGALGRISYVEGYYVHNLTKRAFLYDDWRLRDNATPLVYSGCHFVDLFRWLLQDEVIELMGMANNIAFPEYPESDLNVVLLRFRSGIIGKVVTAFGAGRPQDHSVRVYGSERCLENNILFSKSGQMTIFCYPKAIFTYPLLGAFGEKRAFTLNPKRMVATLRDIRSLKRLLWSSRAYLFGILLAKLLECYKGPPEYAVSSYPLRLYEHSLAVRLSIMDFLDAIRNNGEVKCNVADAAESVAVCLAGVEAYRTNRPVSVSEYSLGDSEVS